MGSPNAGDGVKCARRKALPPSGESAIESNFPPVSIPSPMSNPCPCHPRIRPGFPRNIPLRAHGPVLSWVIAACLAPAPPLPGQTADFGDAPEGYATLLTDNGAHHLLPPGGVSMGPQVDAENDAPAGTNALGDDSHGTDDEDGVVVLGTIRQDALVTLQITASGSCRLDGWIDWAGDGQWEGGDGDANDRFAVSYPLVAGVNQLPLFVPPDATLAPTYARFRVSAAGGLGPAGQAPDGEVEDYRIVIAPANHPANPAVAITRDGTGRATLRWQGSAAYSSQVLASSDLVNWKPFEIPFTETDGENVLPLPSYESAAPVRHFRLRRQPLTTSVIPLAPGLHLNRRYVHGGLARLYNLMVPAGWVPGAVCPLLLMLPGHGQSAEDFTGGQAALIAEAGNRGWVVVVAQATEGMDSFKWFCHDDPNTAAGIYQAEQPYLDDAAFLLELVDRLKASALGIDPARVYLAGFSNGGSMSHYLAGKPNHPFAALSISESGTAPVTSYLEPYNRDAPGTGTQVPAHLPPPWQPRPVLLMNMVTSIPWHFEGRVLGTAPNQIFFNGARHNVARWTAANGYGAVAQTAPEPPLPPATTAAAASSFHFASIPWSAIGAARARVMGEDMRADADWPAALLSQPGWNDDSAGQFRYAEGLIPAWVRAIYPHTLSPDPATPGERVRVDSGTMTVEFWRQAPANRSNEVIFIGLSDGGHQLPGPAEGYPFSNIDVLDFLQAH